MSEYLLQAVSLHTWVSFDNDPSWLQCLPPCSFIGLLQCRILAWVPSPHDAEQVSHSPHSDQLPSTGHVIESEGTRQKIKKRVIKLQKYGKNTSNCNCTIVVIYFLLGQGNSVHSLASLDFDPLDVQWCPPYSGSGLSHSLALVWLPLAQVTEQLVQLVHVPQLPSTNNDKMICYSVFYF